MSDVPPLYVQVHIPKCAGTSVWKWLAKSHPGQHGFLYPTQPLSFVLDERNLKKFAIDNPGLLSMSSHHLRTFPAERFGREMRYFTFLRDPIAQFLSYHTYVRHRMHIVTDPIILSSVPPNTGEYSSRDFAAWLMVRQADVPFRENFQTNFLTSNAWREATGRGPQAWRYEAGQSPEPVLEYPVWDPQDWADYTRVRLDLARETLRSFFFVGIVERMGESLQILDRRLRAAGLPLLPLSELENENVSPDAERDDAAWINEDDAIGRRFLASIAEDRELYRFGLALFEESLAVER